VLSADRPIDRLDADLLNRGPLVERLARWVREAPSDDGFVIGLTGPWGTGKTSILLLLETLLKPQTTVVWFEPWLFSRADELVTRFFDELAAQVTRGVAGKSKRKLRKLGKTVSNYGAALSPVASLVIGDAGQLLSAPKRVEALHSASASAIRRELRRELRSDPQRIVVLIDDIDRLEPHEVREVVRLVKLVADLPGVVHILSYQRSRVEKALGIHDEDGRAYLQKIVQASVAVPPIPAERLRALALAWLQERIGDRALQSWNGQAWSDLLNEGFDGYLHTLRDARRFANMAPTALDECGAEVASMDVLALEAMRIFDPEVHEALPEVAEALVGSGRLLDLRRRDQVEAESQDRVGRVLQSSSDRAVTSRLLAKLFPLASKLVGSGGGTIDSRWYDQKRVADRAVFMRYIHKAIAAAEAASADVDQGVELLADGARLASFLEGIDERRLGNLLDRLRVRLDEQADPDVVGSASAVLRAAPRMIGEFGPFELDPSRRAMFVVDSLIQRLGTVEQRLAAARELVLGAPTLSLQVELLYRYKSRPEAGRDRDVEFLDEANAEELSRALAARIQERPPDALATESSLLWLLGLLEETAGQPDVLARLEDDRVLVAVLQAAGTSFRPHTDGAVSLNLGELVKLAGSEVVQRLREFATQPSGLDEVSIQALRSALADDAAQQEADSE
jgi:energy-coupling factor transporter ATP-binding protein EcfA2